MNVFENICPVCQSKNELEAIVCKHCGTMLHDPYLDPGGETKTTDMTIVIPESLRGWSVDEQAVPENGIAIYVEGEFKPAYVDSRTEFVVGRRVGTTSEIFFDLSPWGAFHLGLSRRHVLIRRKEQGYDVLDLGSVNGTWLNDQRLIPHRSYALSSGSHLRLSRMRLFVLYRPFPFPDSP